MKKINGPQGNQLGESPRDVAGDQIRVNDIIDNEAVAIGRNARAEITKYIEIIVRPDSLEDVPPAPGEQPYKGWANFAEADADNFFGREALSENIVADLHDVHFLAVVGASGSGKSSLLHAGVLPRLRMQNWLIQIITPGARPLERLASGLVAKGSPLRTIDELQAQLAVDPRTLHLAANRLAAQGNASHMLLVVDQFEELFTMPGDESERKAFIDNLLEGVREAGVLTILIALRADYYGHAARYDALRSLITQQQKVLDPLGQKDLVRVIAEPAKRGGWQFVEKLVELILSDAGNEPGRLPLISHVLQETWQLRCGTVMTLGGYMASGGMEGAITNAAESLLERMDKERVFIARHIFLTLTEFGEDAEESRRSASWEELRRLDVEESLINDVVEALVSARLIVVGEDKIEMAHEAIIHHWPRLQSWIDENRDRLSFDRRLTRAAQEWEENDHKPDFLFGGSRLATAERMVEENETFRLTREQEDFIKASWAAVEEEKDRQEAQRQEARLTTILASAGGALGVGAAAILVVIVDPSDSFTWVFIRIYVPFAFIFGALAGLLYVPFADWIGSKVIQYGDLLSWSVAVLTGVVAFVLPTLWLFSFLSTDSWSMLVMGTLWGGVAGAGRFLIQSSDKSTLIFIPLLAGLCGFLLTVTYAVLLRLGGSSQPVYLWLVLLIGMLPPMTILLAERGTRFAAWRNR